MSKEIEKKEDAGLPAELNMFGGYTGFENFQAEDLEIPYLSILQGTSEAVTEGKGKPGQFYRTHTGVATDGIRLIVLGIDAKVFVEWEPNGGSFVARHGSTPPEGAETADGYRYTMPNGNVLKMTDYYYIVDADDPFTVMLFTLKSAGLKYSKKWKTRIVSQRTESGQPIPMPAQIWKLQTALNKYEVGQAYQIGKDSQFLGSYDGMISGNLIPAVKEAVETYKALDKSRIVEKRADPAEFESEAF